MQYTGIAIGPNDLYGGLDFLQRIAATGLPLLSANLIDQSGATVFPPSITRDIGDIRVGIIGLTDSVADVPPGYIVEHWQQVLPAQVQKLSHNCDLLLVLSNLSEKENEEIALKFPQIHILISANQTQGNRSPEIINNTLVTQTHSRGKYLGMLEINWAPSGLWQTDYGRELHSLDTRLNALNLQLSQIKTSDDDSKPPGSKRRQHLIEQQQQLQIQVDRLKLWEKTQQTETPLSTYNANFIALKTNLPASTEIEGKIAAINAGVHRATQGKLIEKAKQASPYRGASSLDQSGFAGVAACGECHSLQATFWRSTNHARAYATLVQKAKNLDLNCLGCHVTWNNTADQDQTDFLLTLPDSLRGVGCESCHGPAAAHSKSPAAVTPRKTVPVNICRSCHTVEMDSGFDYQAKLQDVACPTESD